MIEYCKLTLSGGRCIYWLGRGTGSFWVPKCHAVTSGYLDMCLYKHPSHCPWILSLCLKTPVLWWKNHMRDLRELHLHPDVSFHPLVLSLEQGEGQDYAVLAGVRQDGGWWRVPFSWPTALSRFSGKTGQLLVFNLLLIFPPPPISRWWKCSV